MTKSMLGNALRKATGFKGWHPMATAPKSGRRILGIYADGHSKEICWSESRSHPHAGMMGIGAMGSGWEDVSGVPVDKPLGWLP